MRTRTASQPNQVSSKTARKPMPGVQPRNAREDPLARDPRGSASREEIHRQQVPPAPRAPATGRRNG